MAKRYIPNGPFVLRDKKGHRRTFNPDRRHKDGTVGYDKKELANLEPAQFASFRLVEVSGKNVVEDVEEATSVPGVKRSVTRSKKSSKVAESPLDPQENDESAPPAEEPEE